MAPPSSDSVIDSPVPRPELIPDESPPISRTYPSKRLSISKHITRPSSASSAGNSKAPSLNSITVQDSRPSKESKSKAMPTMSEASPETNDGDPKEKRTEKGKRKGKGKVTWDDIEKMMGDEEESDSDEEEEEEEAVRPSRRSRAANEGEGKGRNATAAPPIRGKKRNDGNKNRGVTTAKSLGESVATKGTAKQQSRRQQQRIDEDEAPSPRDRNLDQVVEVVIPKPKRHLAKPTVPIRKSEPETKTNANNSVSKPKSKSKSKPSKKAVKKNQRNEEEEDENEEEQNELENSEEENHDDAESDDDDEMDLFVAPAKPQKSKDKVALKSKSISKLSKCKSKPKAKPVVKPSPRSLTSRSPHRRVIISESEDEDQEDQLMEEDEIEETPQTSKSRSWKLNPKSGPLFLPADADSPTFSLPSPGGEPEEVLSDGREDREDSPAAVSSRRSTITLNKNNGLDAQEEGFPSIPFGLKTTGPFSSALLKKGKGKGKNTEKERCEEKADDKGKNKGKGKEKDGVGKSLLKLPPALNVSNGHDKRLKAKKGKMAEQKQEKKVVEIEEEEEGNENENDDPWNLDEAASHQQSIIDTNGREDASAAMAMELFPDHNEIQPPPPSRSPPPPAKNPGPPLESLFSPPPQRVRPSPGSEYDEEDSSTVVARELGVGSGPPVSTSTNASHPPSRPGIGGFHIPGRGKSSKLVQKIRKDTGTTRAKTRSGPGTRGPYGESTWDELGLGLGGGGVSRGGGGGGKGYLRNVAETESGAVTLEREMERKREQRAWREEKKKDEWRGLERVFEESSSEEENDDGGKNEEKEEKRTTRSKAKGKSSKRVVDISSSSEEENNGRVKAKAKANKRDDKKGKNRESKDKEITTEDEEDDEESREIDQSDSSVEVVSSRRNAGSKSKAKGKGKGKDKSKRKSGEEEPVKAKWGRLANAKAKSTRQETRKRKRKETSTEEEEESDDVISIQSDEGSDLDGFIIDDDAVLEELKGQAQEEDDDDDDDEYFDSSREAREKRERQRQKKKGKRKQQNRSGNNTKGKLRQSQLGFGNGKDKTSAKKRRTVQKPIPISNWNSFIMGARSLPRGATPAKTKAKSLKGKTPRQVQFSEPGEEERREEDSDVSGWREEEELSDTSVASDIVRKMERAKRKEARRLQNPERVEWRFDVLEIESSTLV